jgi:hypothetical protein
MINKFIKINLIIMLSLGGHIAYAQNNSSTNNSISVNNNVKKGNFIFSGLEKPNNWQFIMGPIQEDNEGLKLVQANNKAIVGIVCVKKDGSEKLGFTVDDQYLDLYTTTTFQVTIGQTTKSLIMKVISSDKTKNTTTWEANGNVVLAVLQALGNIPPLEQGIMTFTEDKKSYSFPVPDPRNLSTVSYEVCSGWNKKLLDYVNPLSGMPLGNNNDTNVVKTNNGLLLPTPGN